MSEGPDDLQSRIGRLLDEELSAVPAPQAPPAVPNRAATPPDAPASGATPPAFREEIAAIASQVLKIPRDRLDLRTPMARYGVDSIIVTEIVKRISDRLGRPVAPTVFFEARHLEELADILHRRHGARPVPPVPRPAAAPDRRPASVVPPAPPSAPAARAGQPAGQAQDWIARFRSLAAEAAGSGAATPRAAPLPAADAPTGFAPVAIVAMEGRFPESRDIGELERHLAEGDDCIREVPPERWDWRALWGDPQQGELTRVKYGGFTPDIDKFDPLFFGLSPKEAELMDPQHRLFMQCVWKLIEAAGYAPSSLSGRKVGIFLGVNLQDYAQLVDRAGAIEALHLTSLGHMFCPNRLSFLLDTHGPSQVIDTACSSSLVALHRAVLSVQHEGCEMAIAGGANLLITPDMHVMYSKVGMICEDGRCKTFSKAANGYVRADGVGAVLVKPLAAAERDGDPILAVIRGSAENHGGLSTSLTAPNPKAQAALIVEAHRRAGVDPRSVGMVECHGTGTALGDPIEINGLKLAFEELYRDAGLPPPEAPHCGLGSIKSNIGHAETAAGIAGVIKAVLSLRRGRLYRSLHCDALNPMIELEGSPFYVLQQGRDWPRPLVEGEAQPRRAGVSSFGAGGSNAHVLLEEYLPPARRAPPAGPALVVLSARTEERLTAQAAALARFLAEPPAEALPDLADLAYTLQVGRDALQERLALVVGSLEELAGKLAAAAGGGISEGVRRGRVKRRREASEGETRAVAQALAQAMAARDLEALAGLWTEGVEPDWPALHAAAAGVPRRVVLPTYPFDERRCWLPEAASPAGPASGVDRRARRRAGTVGHPLLQQEIPGGPGRVFRADFTGEEFFLADHRVSGRRLLPGVAYLEMARAAAERAGLARQGGLRLRNVVWARPFAPDEGAGTLQISLDTGEGDAGQGGTGEGETGEGATGEGGRLDWRIWSRPDATGETVLHSQGVAVAGTGAAPPPLDLATLKAAVGGDARRLDARRCYAAFAAMGMTYGLGHQGIESVWYSDPAEPAAQVLARLVLPAASAASAADFVLHPGLLDSALQACIGLLPAAGLTLAGEGEEEGRGGSAALPFALQELELLAPPPARCWVWIRGAEGSSPSDRLRKLDLDLCDDAGRLCLRLRGFASRTPEPARDSDVPAGEPAAGGAPQTLLCRPVWEAAEPATEGSNPGRRLILICDPEGCLPEALAAAVAARLPEADCRLLPLGGTPGEQPGERPGEAAGQWYADAVVALLEQLRALLSERDGGRTLVQVAIPGRGPGTLLAGLTGLLRTAARESARLACQLVELDPGEPAERLAEALLADGRSPEQAQVRHRDGRREILVWREVEGPDATSAAPWKDGGVYLIAGGAGGLGLLFARRIAAATREAVVVLCGRSEPGPALRSAIEALEGAGLVVRHHRLDIANPAAVERLVEAVRGEFGRLDGVLHAAGLLRDSFIVKKQVAEGREVLAPKVAGAVNLDRATAGLDLDVFALFGSAAGAWGSAGQADYAAANGFLDAFASWREAEVCAGRRRGRTLTVDWPLWAEGGMRMKAGALAMMRETSGLEPLPTAAGLAAFEALLASGATRALVLHGAPARVRRLLEEATPGAGRRPDAAPPPAAEATTPVRETAELRGRIEQALLAAVAEAMKFEPADLEPDSEWSDYGFDSITLTDFSNRLNRQYRLDLTPTVFFEHPTAAELAAWLAGSHAALLAEALGVALRPARAPAPPEPVPAEPPTPVSPATASPVSVLPPGAAPGADAIAVVGMSGCFPMSPDLDAFWANLAAGRDCIGEVPPDRWDWRAIWGDPKAAGNRTDVKWGGFIDGAGDFDARFFGISPREAELMDPAQRLLMTYAWKAIEDAGHSAASLAGSRTAIFVGVAPTGYGDLVAKRSSGIESYSATGTVASVGPNRMSYFLDVHGPSEPIETACSSALVAIHRGVAAIERGECDQAIVGGINLIVSPETHISFDKAGMLSKDGRSKPFSRDANGYARGEGVGMMLLKRLSAAEAHGDRIHGLIRASAENHGGRATSLTAPNPKAQAAVICDAWRRAGRDPRQLGYLEAHGTGTPLGDPVEVTGLKTALQELYRDWDLPEPAAPHCGLGSVKSNIGHLELAAGVSGVIKVLLQLRHRTLAPSLHCDELNPMIRLDGSPFYVVRETQPWPAPRDEAGRELPRLAGISSFGFGGVNAHLVIEEYAPPAPAPAEPQETGLPRPVVLSAKNPERLRAYAEVLLHFITTADGPARPAGDAARGALVERLRGLIGALLDAPPAEIEPGESFEHYGCDPVHRSLLHVRTEAALDVELPARLFLEEHSVEALAGAMLAAAPVLGERLAAEAGTTPAAVGPRIDLGDLAYTLQIGRDAMDARLGLLVSSLDELADRLRAFLEGRAEGLPDCFVAQARQHRAAVAAFAADEELQEALEKWVRRGKLDRLLELWTRGLAFDWQRLYGSDGFYRRRPRRIALPGYPLARQRHWVGDAAPAAAVPATTAGPAPVQPAASLRLEDGGSVGDETRFATLLSGEEFFLADHRVQGRRVLPGVLYLELARAALERARPEGPPAGSVVCLHDVVWLKPAAVEQPRRVAVALSPDGAGGFRYEVASEAADGVPDHQSHGQGGVGFRAAAEPPALDPEALIARGGLRAVAAEGCYELFAAAGLDYGPAHRGLAELHVGAGEVLARLALPDAVAGTLEHYGLHPSLLDAALQAAVGLGLGADEPSGGGARLALPFALESVELFGPCEPAMWAWVRRSPGAVAGGRLQKLDIELADASGRVRVSLRGFASRLYDAPAETAPTAAAPARPVARPAPEAAAPVAAREARPGTASLKARATGWFRELLATALKFPLEEVRADDALDSYGIDSMMVMELTGLLERHFGELSKTLFFEHQTLEELVEHFLAAHRPALEALFAPEPPEPSPDGRPGVQERIPVAPASTPVPPPLARPAPAARSAAARPSAGPLDIAIVGISGRYPQSPDLESYWRNLRDGRDCITEVPPERWDWRAFYGETADPARRHLCKWGGFIEDADKFDALFFSIPPAAAEVMDPQERLFMEHAWMAMEDAGYRREDLRRPQAAAPGEEDLPGQVGVYAGVMYGEYSLLGLEAVLEGQPASISNFYASIANRVSYALNLHGPSMAVDTMCSSSLTAIHLACQDLMLGRTDMAFAGGVNLNLHPNKYSLLSLGHFISQRGKCESFGAGGEGYVPAEGVGVVLLKRLAEAERDGDHIYGVIKASALNHGGRTNGYSVPNPKAQQAVIRRALRESQVDPRAIGYVEAHGTGTRLGDPIEVAGLARAFAELRSAGEPCWIGSSKSNIGHSEAAAGIAGLTKVLLQLREGQIAPSLHAETLNPNIEFAGTPLQVNRQLRDWQRPQVDGRPRPRAAGISSFGAGGANAHLIVEEYLPPVQQVAEPPQQKPALVVLSAKSAPQLRRYAEKLLAFLRGTGRDRLPALRDLAFTLQLGREAQPQRLGLAAASLEALSAGLERYLAGDAAGLYIGRAKAGAAPAPAVGGETGVAAWGEALLAAWVEGAGVDWLALYEADEAPPRRVSLPTYPFERERYWVTLRDGGPVTPRQEPPILSTPPAPAPFPAPFPAPTPAAAPAAAAAAGDAESGTDLLTLRPVWRQRALAAPAVEVAYGEHLVLPLARLPEVSGVRLLSAPAGGAGVDGRFTEVAVGLFEQIRDLVRQKPAAPVLLQVVLGDAPENGIPAELLPALAGLLKTARLENPKLLGQLLELDAETLADPDLAALLRAEGQGAEAQVRYRDGRRELPAWEEVRAAPAVPVWRQGGGYLITGGLGGLGLIFAREILRHVPDARLVLTGRSPLDAARAAELAALRGQGADVQYRPLDVADRTEVAALVGELADAGRLDGILHSAGVLRDAYLMKKSTEDFRAVLAAKVSGVVNLDVATRGLDLDFLALFASIAGATGNPGQADYATANAFLDAYAGYRNRLAAGGGPERPRGLTLSLDWPLWAEGGMDLDAQAKERLWRGLGLRPMASAAGVEAFHCALAAGAERVLVLQGDAARLRGLFLTEPAATAPTGPAQAAAGEQLAERLAARISGLLSEMLKLPAARIENDVPLEEYGVESVMMMKLTDDLERLLGPLPKTLFFEFPTVAAVSAQLATTHAEALAALFGGAAEPAMRALEQSPERPPEAARAEPSGQAPAEPAADAPMVAVGPGDIAIVGMAGRFPQAPDLDRFWRNLAEGRDCVTEVPAERWNHEAWYDPDRSKIGKTCCNWGGFLDGVGDFDAGFFRISPAEAELLDPQERLFLETVWELLESAGCLGETLRERCGSRVGVFVGSMSQQYHGLRADPTREAVVLLSSQSSIANRVSYFFDFRGPSVAIDTMCSSALNAVHLACESLRKGECKVAVAGAVNLTIHPKKYVALSVGQLIGSHADSRSFGDGDGYLPAEAVGAVLLKPLAAALADGDEVLAVVKASGVNHAGQSNGYRVPSASAQAELIAGNLAAAGIDPRTVSYVESAANGSALGDAIELRALAAGFAGAAPQSCPIGSVKSNIGHAEAASGISQLIKVILQLRHRQLVPTIKAEPVNPAIDFAATPFALQRRLEPWRRPVVALDDGEAREYPRRASVSSFGAGGSNAHLLVEEFEAAPVSDAQAAEDPELILLSARTAPQLAAMADRLAGWLEARPDLRLADVAFTLQTAREAMDHRLALLAVDRETLVEALRGFADGRPAAQGSVLFVGDGESGRDEVRQLFSGRTGRAMLELLLAERDLAKLGLYWAKGARIAWLPLHAGQARRRVVLPTYPFERRRHWLPEVEPGAPAAAPAEPPVFELDPRRPRRDEMERYLRVGAARLLGLQESDIAPGRDFHDLGLESIALTRLRRGFEAIFGVTLTARDLLSHPTAAALAGAAAGRESAGRESAGRESAGRESAGREPAGREAAAGEVGSPLSEGQKGLWLLQQLEPSSSAYNVPIALRLEPGFDEALLRRACQYLPRRFPELASCFPARDGEPVRAAAEVALDFDAERRDGFEDAAAIALLRDQARRPFDLERGPLLRARLLTDASTGTAWLLLVAHHLVLDGSSAVLLVEALLAALRDLAAGREPALPAPAAGYGDFVAWQRRFLGGPQAATQRAFWLDRLSGDLPVIELPEPDPADDATAGGNAAASQEVLLDAELAAQLRALARSLQVAPSVVFLGALNLLLRRYCGAEELLVGMPVAGRPEERFESVVGHFVNLLVLRSRVPADRPVAELLAALQAELADTRDNADYPFPTLLRELREARGEAGVPAVRVLYAYQGFLPSADADPAAPARLLPGIGQTGTHELSLEVYQQGQGFRLKLDGLPGRFGPASLRRTLDHLVGLLASMAARPEAPVAAHGLLAPEALRLLAAGAESEAPAPDESVVARFRCQAALTPDAPAVLFEGRALSYAELERESDRLARRLLAQGLAVGAPVAVCLQRGPSAVVACLAVWKAGAPYLPIAPDQPAERLGRLLADSGAGLLLLDAATRAGLGAPPDIACLCAEEDADGSAADPLPEHGAADSPAYVIYTSGSTGEPKGVVVSQGALARHCRVVAGYYGLTAADRVLLFASTSVDVSLEQLLPVLLTGGTLVVRPEALWSPGELRARVAEYGLTVLDLPPAYLHELLLDSGGAGDWAALATLRLAISGGEPLAPETVALWQASPLAGRRLVNAYGPTEATITSLAHEVGAADARQTAAAVPIGRPLPGVRALVLDLDGQPLPDGLPGELYLGGAGLAQGYLGRPELTAERFLELAALPGVRLYRTGDRACRRADGSFLFLGRLDAQVKVRGFRVECGEVEAALLRQSGVRQAAVLPRPLDGREELVAFVVAADGQRAEGQRAEGQQADGQRVEGAALRLALAELLPAHMLPAHIETLAALPVTPAGKLDRAALRALPLASAGVGALVPPRTALEKALAAIWCELLGRERIGVTDDFFALGGHSLLALRLAGLVDRRLGRSLPLSALAAAPTIEAQARLLEGPSGQGGTVCLQPKGTGAPFFCVHAVAGDVLCYRVLAGALGEERPFHALAAPAAEDHPGSIEALAERHLAALRRVQPQGPYRLGGWSLGGVVAYEMARQLRAAGEEVALLALIDSYTPAALAALEPIQAEERPVGAEAEEEEALRAAFEREVPTAAAPQERAHLYALYRANARALAQYRPARYDGTATLFAAEAVPPGAAERGWRDLVEKLEVAAVPGDHYALVRAPAVRALAEALRQRLRRADEDVQQAAERGNK